MNDQNTDEKQPFSGVTLAGRFTSQFRKWKTQLWINGEPRRLGIYDTPEEAAMVADNARIYLQEFIKKPLEIPKLNFPDLNPEAFPPMPVVLALREKLITEGAPKYLQTAEDAAQGQPAPNLVHLAAQLAASLDRIRAELREADTLLRSLRDRLKP